MGIYMAPPDRRRGSLGASKILNGIALVLTAASLTTLGLIGGSVLHSDRLAIALGEGLLALAFVTAAGPGTRSIREYSRRTGDEEMAAIRVERLRRIEEQLETSATEPGPPERRLVRRRRGERPGHFARTPSDSTKAIKGLELN